MMAYAKNWLISLCLFAAATLTGQSTYFDILLNYTPTNFHYGDNQSALKDYRKQVWGIQAGGSWQAGISPTLSVVPEFYFMMQGGQLKGGNPLTGGATKTRLYSLELPLLARLHLSRFYANAGPSVAYNLTGTRKIDPTGELPAVKETLRFDGSEGAFKRWDAGLQLGVGYELPLKKARVAFDVRYHHGLVNLHEGAETYNRYWLMNILISKPWKSNPLGKRR